MHLTKDLRYAARRLSASRGFTAAAVATIAIGVGINTGIFSVLNGIAFRDLPVPASNEIVGIGQTIEGIDPPPTTRKESIPSPGRGGTGKGKGKK